MSATNIQVEVNTKNVEPYLENLFTKEPLDGRFIKIELKKIDPSSGGANIHNTTSTFVLERLPRPQAYKISDVMVSVNVKILKKKDKSMPEIKSKITTIDNILGSLFEKVLLQINGINVDQDNKQYMFRAYLENLLTYSTEVKHTWVKAAFGYYPDRYTNVPGGDGKAHIGPQERQNLFREDFEPTNKFADEGLNLCGKLFHEFSNTHKPIPFGNRVVFQFERTPDSILLYKMPPDNGEEPDNEEYYVDIQQMFLYVPVIIWNTNLCESIEKRWIKDPIQFHFRSYTIIRRSLSKNSAQVQTNVLGENDGPIRVFLAIVNSESYVPGTLDSTPFDFKRRWTYKTRAATSYCNVRSETDFRLALKQVAEKTNKKALEKIMKERDQMMQQMQKKFLKENEKMLKRLLLASSAQPIAPAPVSSMAEPEPVAGPSGVNQRPKRAVGKKKLIIGGAPCSTTSSKSSKISVQDSQEIQEIHKRNSFLKNQNVLPEPQISDPDYEPQEEEEEDSDDQESGDPTPEREMSEDEEEVINVNSFQATPETLNLRKLQLEIQGKPVG